MLRTRVGNGLALVGLASLLLCGCNKVAPVPVVPSVVDEGPVEPAEAELSNPKYKIDDDGNFYFQVDYKFTKGRARQFYLLTVKFPGTENMCLKHMEAYHLKEKEGVIRDGIPLTDKSLTTYEIFLSEADSPMNEYKPISNTVTGEVAKAP